MICLCSPAVIATDHQRVNVVGAEGQPPFSKAEYAERLQVPRDQRGHVSSGDPSHKYIQEIRVGIQIFKSELQCPRTTCG
jgi:hypothetical protein